MPENGKQPTSDRVITRIALVSGSPRRRMLLDQLGISYTVSVPGVDESVERALRPSAHVREIARRKMMSYIERNGSIREASGADAHPVTPNGAPGMRAGEHPGAPEGSPGPGAATGPGSVGDWALAADTVVALGRKIIGKPGDSAEARRILRGLSGRSHRVITALALYNPHSGSIALRTAATRVTFGRLSEEEIEWYVRSGEWRDAAGGYRIQERGSVLVRRIVGSYSNVVGLPLETFYGMVVDQGFYLFPSGG